MKPDIIFSRRIFQSFQNSFQWSIKFSESLKKQYLCRRKDAASSADDVKEDLEYAEGQE